MTLAPGSDGAVWKFETIDGVLFVRCLALCGVPGVAHAFSTRRDGTGAAFDLGAADDRSEEIRGRRARFLTAAGIEGEAAVLRQVHGDRMVDADEALGEPPEADGAVWSGGFAAPAVRSADCLPILIVDRAGRAAAAVHAGWRGSAAGIARRAVAALAEFDVTPLSLIAAIGPAIGPCCYEVGDEVVDAFGGMSETGSEGLIRRNGSTGRSMLDLKEINRRQLTGSGVPPGAIYLSPWCTRCRADLFFSFRGEGEQAGRLMAAVGRRRRP